MTTSTEPFDALDEWASRADDATRQGAQAFARLLALAEQRNSGQIQRVARFVAAAYNGLAFPSCSFEHDGNNAKRRLMRTGL